MNGFILVVCVLGMILAYTGQTFFNKLYSGAYKGSASAATPVFAGIYGLMVAVFTLCISGFRFAPSAATWLYGLGNGALLFLYQLGCIQAARRGPYSFQSIVMLFGNILCCLLFSVIFWNEKMSLFQILGVFVMLVSLFILNGGGTKLEGIKKGYFFWVISLFLSNGFVGVMFAAQQRAVENQQMEMIVITFASSALISLLYLLITQRGRTVQALKMGRKAGIFTAVSSICASVAVNMLMVLLSHIPSYILYTLNNGGIMVGSVVLSAIVLKEKLTKLSFVGILLAVGSVVLLSI